MSKLVSMNNDIGHSIFGPITDFFKGPKAPKAPKPTPLPDEVVLAQTRRRRLASMQHGGRDSTIMSDTLGG